MSLPLIMDLTNMNAPRNQEQDAITGAVQVHNGPELTISPSQKRDPEPAVLRPKDGLVNPAIISQALHKINNGLSFLPIAPMHGNEAVVALTSKQQLYLPVLVANVPDQDTAATGHEVTQPAIDGPDTPATTPSTTPTAESNNFDSLVQKARIENLTVTPAMEAHANVAPTLPPVKTLDIEAEHLPRSNLKYYNEGSLSAATRLKRRLAETNELIVCPGVYDGFSARIALSVGFTALYMTGAGTTASRLGMADLGVAQLHDMREHAEMIANLDPKGPPLIADMDTGYGGPIMVTNSVLQYIRAGVAGFHIEDQIQNKRCGHLQGKKVVDIETFLSRIRAAKAAKDRAQSDIVLIARTDANQQHGYDECIRRLKAAREIGADVGLLEGFTSKEQARKAVQELAPWPLLLNSVENGTSPLITAHEAKEMGFRIMIFSFASLAPAYTAIKSALEKLKRDGVTGTKKELTPKVLFEVCGLGDSMEVDKAAGGLDFVGGV